MESVDDQAQPLLAGGRAQGCPTERLFQENQQRLPAQEQLLDVLGREQKETCKGAQTDGAAEPPFLMARPASGWGDIFLPH